MGNDCFNPFGSISRKLKAMTPPKGLLHREP
ncbi:MAG: hypothetical protein RL397_590 [Pseudomonadota bacterium]|jgi:hypothetical protein